jgi:hypothetical protein
MSNKMRLASLIVAASLLLILGTGCASSSGGAASSPVQSTASSASGSGIYVKQVAITPYMRSQIGTPNEMSPLAPSQARNVRKVGDEWLCDINGQVYVYDGASRWEPQAK